MLPGPLIPQIAPGYYSTRETIAHNFTLRMTNPRTIALKLIHQPDERHTPGSKRPRKPASQQKSRRPTGARLAHTDQATAFAASDFCERTGGNLGASQPKPPRASTRKPAGSQPQQEGHKTWGGSRLPRFSTLTSFSTCRSPTPTRESASR